MIVRIYLEVEGTAHVDVGEGHQDCDGVGENLGLDGLLANDGHGQLLLDQDLLIVTDFGPDFGEPEKVSGDVEHLAPLGDAAVLAQVEHDLLAVGLILLVLERDDVDVLRPQRQLQVSQVVFRYSRGLVAVVAGDLDLGGVVLLQPADIVGREGQVPALEVGQNLGSLHDCQEQRQ